MRKLGVCLYVSLFLLGVSKIFGEAISVDCGKRISQISPNIYGTCLEDLNHEVYGGLYSQLIFGESFSEPSGSALPCEFKEFRGKWRTLADYTECEPNSEGALLLFSKKNFVNGKISCDLAMNVYPGSPTLIFGGHFNDKGRYTAYGVQMNKVRGVIAIVKIEHLGKMEQLLEIPMGKSDLEREWNRLGAKFFKFGRIELEFNGKTVGEFFVKDGIPEGSLGLYARHASTKFKNLNISGDDKFFKYSLYSGRGHTLAEGVSGMWCEHADSFNAKYFVESKREGRGQIIEVSEGFAGVVNKSVGWGMNFEKNKTYEGFVILESSLSSGGVSVQLLDDKMKVLAEKELDLPKGGGKVKKCEFKMSAPSSCGSGAFAIAVKGCGKVLLKFAYLVPSEKWKGSAVRSDIAEKMKESGINLIRYGGTMVNNAQYKFKNMLGSPEQRSIFRGHWYRYSTLGFGLVEFVGFCESMGVEPVIAINVEEDPKDVADMIEYFNGSANTEWGALRAADGHPEPYNLKYVEIGNEEMIHYRNSESYSHYAKRFKLLRDAMFAKDKNLKFICAEMWTGKDEDYVKELFLAIDGICDYWDLHLRADTLDSGKKADKTIAKMRGLFKKWNPESKMKCMILEENGSICNVQRALGHAGILNAVRKHADFVCASCPANALQAWQRNFNGWNQGQIFFTSDAVFGMPPFHVQKMDSSNYLPVSLETSAPESLDVSAAISEDGKTLAVYVLNAGDKAVLANLKVSNFNASLNKAKVFFIRGELEGINTPENPEAISAIESVENFSEKMSREFAPHSYTILRFGEGL